MGGIFVGLRWWILYHGRIGSIILNVSRHFTHPRDAKFCDEYASEGLVLTTSLLEEDDWSVVDRHFVMVA